MCVQCAGLRMTICIFVCVYFQKNLHTFFACQHHTAKQYNLHSEQILKTTMLCNVYNFLSFHQVENGCLCSLTVKTQNQTTVALILQVFQDVNAI